MLAIVDRPRIVQVTSKVVLLILMASPAAAGTPVGGFIAVLNESRSYGDSMNSVTFFDTDDVSVPLFSVYVGREPVGSNEWEEPTAMTVDPATGDVYLVAFDSGTTGVPDTAGDVQGDLDLYKIPFATIYDHWSTNFAGLDVQSLPNPDSWGNAPTGTNNASNLDYVTYASTYADFNAFHSNTFALAGSSTKIGQVNRGNGNDFYEYSIDFIDGDTLFMLDDSVGTSAANDPLDDHSFRVLRKVSDLPGMATSTVVDRMGVGTNYSNGGYNGSMGQASAQSWESELISFMNLDGAGHSEPENSTYSSDPVSGVRGVWVTERDMPAAGDNVAFVELDANNAFVQYRPQVGGGSPFFLTLSNDPANGEDLLGKADNIFVDEDSGDLIIVESGYNDAVDLVGPDHEPGVLRVSVDYDNGLGEIEFGTWQQKIILNPTKDPGDVNLERGQWTTYDSVNDVVYFFNPGGGSDTPPFEMDIYALDLNTGITTSYLNVDDSVSLYLGDAFGDKAAFMYFAEAGLPGDYNGNGKVDAADYTVWRDNLGSGTSLPSGDDTAGVGPDDYTRWVNNFGMMSGSGSTLDGSSAVPEPASATLVLFSMFFALWPNRRFIAGNASEPALPRSLGRSR
jgi:hypothetical protein